MLIQIKYGFGWVLVSKVFLLNMNLEHREQHHLKTVFHAQKNLITAAISHSSKTIMVLIHPAYCFAESVLNRVVFFLQLHWPIYSKV